MGAKGLPNTVDYHGENCDKIVEVLLDMVPGSWVNIDQLSSKTGMSRAQVSGTVRYLAIEYRVFDQRDLGYYRYASVDRYMDDNPTHEWNAA